MTGEQGEVTATYGYLLPEFIVVGSCGGKEAVRRESAPPPGRYMPSHHLCAPGTPGNERCVIVSVMSPGSPYDR